MTGVTLEAEDGDTDIFGTTVSDIQADIEVADGKITGTLMYVSEGQIVTDWGAGYFLALAFDDFDKRAVSVKVGLDPSEGSGLVEAINDPDRNGIFKITNKDVQRFKVVSRDADGNETVQTWDLSGLSLEV